MQLSTNLLIQYILVGAILVGAVVWVIWKMVGLRKNKVSSSSCCGCSLNDCCSKKEINTKKGNGSCH